MLYSLHTAPPYCCLEILYASGYTYTECVNCVYCRKRLRRPCLQLVALLRQWIKLLTVNWDIRWHWFGMHISVWHWKFVGLTKLLRFSKCIQSFPSIPATSYLWLPCVADADIIFSSCGFFFFSSPNLSRRTLDVCHTSTHDVASVRIYNVGLKCAAYGSWKIQDTKNCQKISRHLGTIARLCWAVSPQRRHVLTIGKKTC